MLASACTPRATCPEAGPLPSTQPVTVLPPEASESPNSTACEIEEHVRGARLDYVLCSGRFPNLVYQLDCMSGLTSCSRAAYRHLWRTRLGGLDADDEEALAAWRSIRERYQGRIEAREELHLPPSPLPVAHLGRRIEERIRIAALSSRNIHVFAHNMSFFLDAADVDRAAAIASRFDARFGPYWAESGPEMRASAKAFAALLGSPRLADLADGIAAFYAVDVPGGARIVFDLVARPAHDSADAAKQLGNHAIVEVRPGTRPETRIDVVLHELFHFYFAAGRYDQRAALAARFADSPSPLGLNAYGLLEEVLATAFGNGLVQRTVDEPEFRRRLAQPMGFYNDEFIDRISKAVLEPLEARLTAGGTLHDADFVPEFVGLVEKSYPRGMPPRAYLRTMVIAHDDRLGESYDALAKLAHANWMTSESSLDPKVAGAMFDERPLWTAVWMAYTPAIEALRAWERHIGAKEIAVIEALARRAGSFVYASRRVGGAWAFVFVAPDDASMKALIEAFAKVETMKEGVLVSQ